MGDDGLWTQSVSVNLADTNVSGHLDPEVHSACTYTYDILVMEYTGDTAPNGPEHAATIDYNYLKYPYCLWVPESTPETPPRPGHDVWFYQPEGDEPAQIRVDYWLHDQCQRGAADLELVVVDPDLQVRRAVGGPWPQTLNTLHGGEDADQDGKPDGITVYELAPDDPPETWRVLWTAQAPCGVKTRNRRTHDAQRMLVANAPPRNNRKLLFAFVTFAEAEKESTFYQAERLHTDGKAWSVAKRYPACSGSPERGVEKDMRNCYANGYEWNCGMTEYTGGPIPRTKTVEKHKVGRENSAHAVICTGMEWPGDKEEDAMKVEEDAKNNGILEDVQYKFAIYNILGDKVFKQAAPGTGERGTNGRLLVHPDGGHQGTAGCIGIEAKQGETYCTAVRNTLLAIDADPRWHTWHYVRSREDGRLHKGVPLWVAGDALDLIEKQDWLSDSVWKVVNP